MQRVAQATRELRDQQVQALQAKWQPKIARAAAKVDAASDKLARVDAAQSAATLSATVDVGVSILGALFGSGRGSGVRAAGRAVKGASKVAGKHGDAGRARADLDEARAACQAVEQEANDAVTALQATLVGGAAQLEELRIPAARGGVVVEVCGLAWLPAP